MSSYPIVLAYSTAFADMHASCVVLRTRTLLLFSPRRHSRRRRRGTSGTGTGKKKVAVPVLLFDGLLFYFFTVASRGIKWNGLDFFLLFKNITYHIRCLSDDYTCSTMRKFVLSMPNPSNMSSCTQSTSFWRGPAS